MLGLRRKPWRIVHLEVNAVWTSKLFGLNLASWEGWLPLGVGLGAGLLSLMAVGVAVRRKQSRSVTTKTETEKPAAADPFVLGSALEHRKALRRQGNPVKVFLAPPGEENPQGSAWV